MPSSLIRIAKAASVLLVAPVAGVGFDGGSGSASGSGVRPGTAYLQGSAPQERMAVVDPDKKLSAGDLVTLEIVEDQEGGLPRVVTATGELDVPPLRRVQVAGKTTTAAAAAEIKRLLEKDYYFTATVRLSSRLATSRVTRSCATVTESLFPEELSEF